MGRSQKGLRSCFSVVRCVCRASHAEWTTKVISSVCTVLRATHWRAIRNILLFRGLAKPYTAVPQTAQREHTCAQDAGHVLALVCPVDPTFGTLDHRCILSLLLAVCLPPGLLAVAFTSHATTVILPSHAGHGSMPQTAIAHLARGSGETQRSSDVSCKKEAFSAPVTSQFVQQVACIDDIRCRTALIMLPGRQRRQSLSARCLRLWRPASLPRVSLKAMAMRCSMQCMRT